MMRVRLSIFWNVGDDLSFICKSSWNLLMMNLLLAVVLQKLKFCYSFFWDFYLKVRMNCSRYYSIERWWTGVRKLLTDFLRLREMVPYMFSALFMSFFLSGQYMSTWQNSRWIGFTFSSSPTQAITLAGSATSRSGLLFLYALGKLRLLFEVRLGSEGRQKSRLILKGFFSLSRLFMPVQLFTLTISYNFIYLDFLQQNRKEKQESLNCRNTTKYYFESLKYIFIIFITMVFAYISSIE